MISKNQNINLLRKYLEDVKTNLQSEYDKALENASEDIKKNVTKIEITFLENFIYVNIHVSKEAIVAFNSPSKNQN